MRLLRLVVGLGTLLIIAGGFTLSYGKLNKVALIAGYGDKAWIYPAIVEGFNALAMLAAFLRHGQRGAWYPWTVGLMVFAYSLWANAVPESVPVEIVSAVPVLCIPLSVHMLLIIAGFVDSREKALALEAEPAENRRNEQERGLSIFRDVVPEDFRPEASAPVSPAPEGGSLAPAPAGIEPDANPAITRRQRRSKRSAPMADPDVLRQLAEEAKTPEHKEFWEELYSQRLKAGVQ